MQGVESMEEKNWIAYLYCSFEGMEDPMFWNLNGTQISSYEQEVVELGMTDIFAMIPEEWQDIIIHHIVRDEKTLFGTSYVLVAGLSLVAPE